MFVSPSLGLLLRSFNISCDLVLICPKLHTCNTEKREENNMEHGHAKTKIIQNSIK